MKIFTKSLRNISLRIAEYIWNKVFVWCLISIEYSNWNLKIRKEINIDEMQPFDIFLFFFWRPRIDLLKTPMMDNW